MDSLGIKESCVLLAETSEISSKVERAVKMFENHQWILKIKDKIQNTPKFEFEKNWEYICSKKFLHKKRKFSSINDRNDMTMQHQSIGRTSASSTTT